jgi:hypothetical protein
LTFTGRKFIVAGTSIDQPLGKKPQGMKEVTMRTSLSILTTTLALSFVLLLTPRVSNAQVAAKDCTAGNGLYSCDFKDEFGNLFPDVPLNFSSNQNISTIVIGQDLALSCACGLQGSVDDTDPLKKNSSVLCTSTNFFGFSPPFALAGKISGNPTKPANLKFGGQLQEFNSPFNSTGFLFDCVSQGNFTK